MPSIFELQAPLLTVRAARVDSPVSGHAKYADDVKFFHDHPNRHTHIRTDCSEFDLEMPPPELLQTPRLWNLVIQVAKGVHILVPIYRGAQFWDWTIKDDAAVGIILVEMARQEGFNQAEFTKFAKRVVEQNKELVKANETGKLVH